MPIQVPTLNRFKAQDTPSVGRENINVPNAAAAIAPQARAAEGVVDETAKYFQKEEEHAIDSISNATSYDYHGKLEGALEQAKKQGGDPTEVYKKLDEDSKGFRQQILDDKPDLSPKARAAVEAKLQDIDNKFYSQRTVAESSQRYTYDTSLTNNLIKVAQSGMVSDSTLIDKNNPKPTLIEIQKRIDDIMNQAYSHGEKYGTVTKDEAGHFKPGPSVQLQVEKDTSDGLTETITNLSNAGKTEEAQMVKDKFGHLINAAGQKKLANAAKGAQDKQAVNDLVASAAHLDGDAAVKAIEDSGKPIDVQNKALALLDASKRHKEGLIAKASKTNANAALNYSYKAQSGDTAYQNFDEAYHKDPVLSATYDNVTDAKQKAAIRAVFDVPPTSNQKALAEAWTKLNNGEFKGMDPSEFAQVISQLDKPHRAIMESEYRKGNAPNPGQDASLARDMGSMLNKSLQANGYVTPNRFGKYEGDDLTKLNNSYMEMREQLETNPPGPSSKDRAQWAKDFANSKLKGTLFKPSTSAPTPKTFNGGGPVAPTQTKTQDVIDQERLQFKKEFRAKNGRFPNEQENLAFLKSQRQGN